MSLNATGRNMQRHCPAYFGSKGCRFKSCRARHICNGLRNSNVVTATKVVPLVVLGVFQTAVLS